MVSACIEGKMKLKFDGLLDCGEEELISKLITQLRKFPEETSCEAGCWLVVRNADVPESIDYFEVYRNVAHVGVVE